MKELNDPLAQKERDKYQTLWRECPGYRQLSPGEDLAVYFFHSFQHLVKKNDRIIDFGCGTGRAAKHFLAMGLHVTLVDFCSIDCLDPEILLLLSLFPEKIRFIEACLWNLPVDLGMTEWVYCCDVLEHIPEEKIEAVLSEISSRHLKGGYMSICLQEDSFGKVLNETLHLCIKTKEWWHEKLGHHWNIQESTPSTNNYFHCHLTKNNETIQAPPREDLG